MNNVDAITKVPCYHPSDQIEFEKDGNGGTVAYCHGCNQDITKLLPEAQTWLPWYFYEEDLEHKYDIQIDYHQEEKE